MLYIHKVFNLWLEKLSGQVCFCLTVLKLPDKLFVLFISDMTEMQFSNLELCLQLCFQNSYNVNSELE